MDVIFLQGLKQVKQLGMEDDHEKDFAKKAAEINLERGEESEDDQIC